MRTKSSGYYKIFRSFLSDLFFHSTENLQTSSSFSEASNGGGSDHIKAQIFPFRELAAATRNFRADCLLGEGGFGRVYKGNLESINQVSNVSYSTTVYQKGRLVV